MRFFQHVLSLCEIERTGQLDAWLERFDAVVVPGGHGAVSMLEFPRVHAAIDGHLATARGAWSDWPFVSAVLPLLASAPERAA
jgi:hypothetical protein